jgi:hypothetical protein
VLGPCRDFREILGLSIQKELIWFVDKKDRFESSILDVIIKIMRSMIPCHCGDRSCEEFKELRAGCNLNRGFVRRARGGWRSIAGPKVV